MGEADDPAPQWPSEPKCDKRHCGGSFFGDTLGDTATNSDAPVYKPISLLIKIFDQYNVSPTVSEMFLPKFNIDIEPTSDVNTSFFSSFFLLQIVHYHHI